MVWGIVAFQIVAFASSRFDQIISDVSNSDVSNGVYIPGLDNGYYVVHAIDPEVLGSYFITPRSMQTNWYNTAGSTVNPSTTSTAVRFVKSCRIPISSGENAGKHQSWSQTYHVYYSSSGPTNLPQDTDGDGVKDDIDPCIDSYDTNFKIYRAKNVCTGSYYFFQITGECGNTETYFNPIYDSEKSAYEDSLANPECSPISSFATASMSAQDFENWYAQHHPNVNVGGSSPDDAIPDQSIPDPTGGNSTVQIPPKPVDASDPDSQKVIDQIERMKVAVEQAVQFSGQKVAGQVQVTGDQIVAGLKGVTNAVNGLSMGGVSTAVNSAATTAHSDSQAMLQKLEEIKNKPVSNATASATLELPSVSVSGSFTIPEPGVLEPVSEDRVIAAKERFMNAWDNLKNSFSGIFDLNLSGSGSLPVWTWPILGQNIVIDFNEYSTELNWIGLALLFIASVYAIFIVFGN
jgi:hypothetical protein